MLSTGRRGNKVLIDCHGLKLVLRLDNGESDLNKVVEVVDAWKCRYLELIISWHVG